MAFRSKFNTINKLRNNSILSKTIREQNSFEDFRKNNDLLNTLEINVLHIKAFNLLLENIKNIEDKYCTNKSDKKLLFKELSPIMIANGYNDWNEINCEIYFFYWSDFYCQVLNETKL